MHNTHSAPEPKRPHTPGRWVLVLIPLLLMLLAIALSAQAETGVLAPAAAGAAVQASPEGGTGSSALLPAAPDKTLEEALPRPISVKIEGTVTEIGEGFPPGILVVNDIPVHATVDTRIRPPFLLPQVGDVVVIRATIEEDPTGEEPEGRCMASYIRVIRDDGVEVRPFQFRGLITDFPAEPYIGRWTISGVTVVVTDDKVRSGPTPEQGFFAHVAGFMQRDRTVRAVQLQVLKPVDVLNRFEFKGPVQVMGTIPGDWIIGQVRGHVETTTQIDGPVALGLMVQVKGYLGEDGQPVFERIRALSADDQTLRIEGPIEEIIVEDDGYGFWVVAGQTIEVDDQTFVDESRARAIRGNWASVTAREEGHYPYALRIRVERPE